MTTLEDLYFKRDAKRIEVSVWIGTEHVVLSGVEGKEASLVSWEYSMGQAPTAEVVIPRRMPKWLAKYESGNRSPITIDAGFNGILTRVFTGRVDTMERTQSSTAIRCIGFSRRIEASFERNVVTLAGVDATTAVENLLQAAGVANYAVDLPAWSIGAEVAQDIDFSSYGEAINRIAEVDGSPWYEMPSGQIRVDVRDPLPAGAAWRTYYSGTLDGPSMSRPPGANPEHLPRIVSATISEAPREIRNRVTVQGASVTELNPGTMEEVTRTIESTCEGESDYIPDPPEHIGFAFQSQLIDTDEKAATVCLRHLALRNRRHESMNLVVPGDPEAFLGATIRVFDSQYTGTTRRWFVEGYSSSIDGNSFTTNYNLLGSPDSPGAGQLDPFADFVWSLDYDPPPAEGSGPPGAAGAAGSGVSGDEDEDDVAYCANVRPHPSVASRKVRNTVPITTLVNHGSTVDTTGFSDDVNLAKDLDGPIEKSIALIAHLGYRHDGSAVAATGFGENFLSNVSQVEQVELDDGRAILTVFIAECEPIDPETGATETLEVGNNIEDTVHVLFFEAAELSVVGSETDSGSGTSLTVSLGGFSSRTNVMFMSTLVDELISEESAEGISKGWGSGGPLLQSGSQFEEDGGVYLITGWGVNEPNPSIGVGSSMALSGIAVEVDAGDGGDATTTKGFTAIGVTFWGGVSKDFDGQIASYAWSDDQGNVGSGDTVIFHYDPCEISTVEMTLTVTDNDGRTNSITKRIRLRSALDVRCPKESGEGGGNTADWESPPAPDDESGDDSENGGGSPVDTVLICAADHNIIATVNSGDDWNILSAGDVDPAAAGRFTAVDTMFVITDGTVGALLGTSLGELVWTDDAAQSAIHLGAFGGSPEITAVKADPTVYNRWWVAAADGRLFVYENRADLWYTVAEFNTPMRKIDIGPRGEIVMYGGDADNPLEAVVRGNGIHFWSIVDGGLVEAAIAGDGAVDGRLYGDGTIVVVLGEGAEVEAWMSVDALYGDTDWQPANTGGYSPRVFGGAFRPDYGDGVLISGTQSVVLVNEDGVLTEESVHPIDPAIGNINSIIPEPGMAGVFVAASDSAILKSTNGGRSWGPIFPSETLGGDAEWPGDSIGRDVAVGYQFVQQPLGDVLLYLSDGDEHSTARLGHADTWIPLSSDLEGEPDKTGPMLSLTTRLIAFRAGKTGTGLELYEGDQYDADLQLSTDGGATWSLVVPPVFSINSNLWTFDTYYWSAFQRGENQKLVALYSSNSEGFMGNLSVIATSEDNGASWENRLSFIGKAFNIDTLAESPNVLLVNLGSHFEGDTFYGSLALDLDDTGLFSESYPHTVTTLADFAALSIWGHDRRVITAGLLDGASEIRYQEVDSSYVIPFEFTTSYRATDEFGVGIDAGKIVGLVRMADTPVLFACFEDHGPLRSRDGGDTWELMPRTAGFAGWRWMDYDQADDMLWVSTSTGIIVWPCASVIGTNAIKIPDDSAFIPMRAIYNLEDMEPPEVGYGGVVIRQNRQF